jgi:hypothetical protein
VVARTTTGEDDPVPRPTIVWMVHLGRGVPPVEVRGTLRLGETALEFAAVEAGGDASIGFSSIRKAKRIRGSPVLMVDWIEGATQRRTAFYFSQPPPLSPAPRSPSVIPPGPLGPFTRATPSKRQVARMNLGYLRSTSATNRETVRAWEREVAERAGG